MELCCLDSHLRLRSPSSTPRIITILAVSAEANRRFSVRTPVDTPASLLERLRRPDDREAWARFVELYTPLLYFWARRTGLQQADAADLVQEVLAVLFRKLLEFTYDKQRSFRNWLRTVTLNKWRETVRRR